MSRLYPCVYCTEDGYCKKFSDEEVTSWCVQGPCKDETPSNADRIRQMNDEELDEFLNEVQGDAYIVGFHQRAESRFTPYGKRWLDWLKAPVDKEGEG